MVGRAVVSNGEKSVDDSTRRRGGEGGKSAFDIHVYFHVQCRPPLQRLYHAPYDIHRRLEWSQLGRHFIVNLLLLFVRLAAPRCYRDRQDSFCRLLTLTGRSRRGFSFFLMLHISSALAFICSKRRVRLDLFCEVQQEMCLWWVRENGLKLREKRRFAQGYVYAINRLQ